MKIDFGLGAFFNLLQYNLMVPIFHVLLGSQVQKTNKSDNNQDHIVDK
jgi:hypothetical protein